MTQLALARQVRSASCAEDDQQQFVESGDRLGQQNPGTAAGLGGDRDRWQPEHQICHDGPHRCAAVADLPTRAQT